METEKRNGTKPLPDNTKAYINDAQRAELNIIEGFGWHLSCIRRPLFQEPVLIVTSADNDSLAVLENNGELNLNPEIKVRK